MTRWMKNSLITGAVIIGLLLLSMLIVPWQVKKQGPAWIADNTERTLIIEKAYFNPFILKLELSGVTLTEATSDQPFISWDRLMVSLSLRSIIDKALILRRIELDHPYVKVDLLGSHEFNFSDFMHLSDDPLPADPVVEDEASRPFLFSLNNIVITSGEIDFNDQASPQSSHHEIRQLALSVPVIGNVSYLADEYVTPELSLLLNGADIHAEGQSKPFNNTLETDLSLELFNTDLAYYAQNAPVALPIDVKSGVLDCEINLTYLVSTDELPQLLIDGDFALSNLLVNEPDGTHLFAMPSLLVDIEQMSLFKQEITLSKLVLCEPHLTLSRDDHGQLNLIRLFTSSTPQSKPEGQVTEEAESSLPSLLVRSLELQQGQISFNDRSLTTAVAERIHDLSLTVTNLSTHADQQAKLKLHVQTDRQLDIAMTGQLGVVPTQAELSFIANGFELEPYYPYLQSLITAPVKGTLDVVGQVTYADGNTQLHDVALTLRDLLVPFSGKDHFKLGELQLRDTSVDLTTQQIQLGQLSLMNGDIKATRFADSTFSPEKILRPSTTKAAPQSESSQQPVKPWDINLASVDLNAFKLQFRDQTTDKKPLLVVNQFGLHVEDISYPIAKKSPLKLTAKVGTKGDIRLSGTMLHTPLRLDATARLKAFELSDFNDFIPSDVKLKVKDGQLFSTIALDLKQQNNVLQGTFSGDIAINRFDLLDGQGKQLLRWGGLNVTGIQGEIAPFALHIKEVALNDYQANIEVADNGQMNLTSVSSQETVDVIEESESVDAERVAKTEPTEVKNGEPPADIRIDAVTLQGGTVSFIDRHLPSTFATTMYDLGGRISGLAADEEMQADVDLRGHLENSAPLTITGKINPLSRDMYADLMISFKNIDLSPMTPYSGSYLGYAIDKGKLYLDLNYTIEHQQIEADNKVMIDQFTFGESIDSDEATSLPVALAISLLKDTNDEIHLDIPISGNLNDPDFSLAGTIFTVLRNLLVKAATSPFALLSSMIGGGEDVSSVPFTLGLSTINDDQSQLLVNLADILTKRPSLTLEISPYVDQNNDPEAYRQQQLTEMVHNVKWNDLDDDQQETVSMQQVDISAEEYPKLLKKVYKQAEFPRPRNMVGLLKSLPTQEMEKLLLANIKAGEDEMAALAKARAMAVHDGLIAINAELKPRLFLMTTDIYAEPVDGEASRVEFGISAK